MTRNITTKKQKPTRQLMATKTVSYLVVLLMITKLTKTQKTAQKSQQPPLEYNPKPNDDVKLVIELISHGSSGPALQLRNESWLQKSYLDQLTAVGERQSYLLGRNTYQRFKAFFDANPIGYSTQNDYIMEATSANKTLQSTFSHMIGLRSQVNVSAEKLPFKNGDPRMSPPQQLFFNPAGLGFDSPLPGGLRSFPIHSSFDKVHNLQLGVKDSCPVVINQRMKYFSKGVNFLDKNQKFKTFFQGVLDDLKIGKGWLKQYPLVVRCAALGNFVLADYQNTQTPLLDPKASEKNKTTFGLLKRCYSYYVYSTIIPTSGDTIKGSKILTSAVNSKIEVLMKHARNGTAKQKYALYSGNEETISDHLNTIEGLNLSCVKNDLLALKASPEAVCPDSAGSAVNLVWELVQKVDLKKWFGKVSYNGRYLDYCHKGVKDEYGDFICPYEDFIKALGAKIVKNYQNECIGNVVKFELQKRQFYIIIIAGCLFIAAAAWMFALILKLKEEVKHWKDISVEKRDELRTITDLNTDYNTVSDKMT